MNDKVPCLECGKSFRQITLTHLKSHAMTLADYRSRYPEALLVSDAVLEKVRAASTAANSSRKGVARSADDRKAIREGIAKAGPREAHNRGKVMSDEQKALLSSVAKEGYASGSRRHVAYERTPEIREKIAARMRGRTPDSNSIKKAMETKRQRYGDESLAFFKGRTHSEESKAKISQKGRERYAVDRPEMRTYMLVRMAEAHVTLKNDISADVFELECQTCQHRFTRTPQCFHHSKYHIRLCDQCFPISPVSRAETEIADWIESLGFEIVRSDAETIAPLELDIVVPSLKLAIEYCGIYWHSELAGKSRWYHRRKMETANAKGLRLITIFEDEWLNRPDLVRDMLRAALGIVTAKINARSCTVGRIDARQGRDFIAENHLQGGGRAKLYYGLWYQETLISVMSFSNSEVSRGGTGWDMNRFCSQRGTMVRGGASKLFKAFVREQSPTAVVSYADLRWGTGSVYAALGFQPAGNTVPNYWYFRPNEMKRTHRYALRKNPDDDQALSEWNNRRAQGWNRIWDCGHAKWVWVS